LTGYTRNLWHCRHEANLTKGLSPDVCRDDDPEVPKTRLRTPAPIVLSPEDIPEDPSRPVGVVAFDFDGTMTVRDSFTAFLAWRAGPADWARGLAALAPAAGRYLADRDRGRMKAAAVKRFLAGMPRVELEALAREFAEAQATRLLRPDALRSWRYWRARGATLAIVTASPEILVAPFARGLGADHLLGTRLAVDADGRITGDLEGANCRGPEKTRRLREIFGPDLHLAAAYGDTAGDADMLSIAAHAGYREFREKP
jgi:phosphatidylglycerophosphatase C